MVLLSDNANDETGECWPSQTYLAKRSGLTRQSVNKIIKTLSDAGHITVQNRIGNGMKTSNMYRVLSSCTMSNNQTKGMSNIPTEGVKISDIESVIEPVNEPSSDNIWSVWERFAGKSARPVLGKLIKQYGEHEVAKAIGVTILKQPADPKGYIYGVLNQNKRKRKGFQA